MCNIITAAAAAACRPENSPCHSDDSAPAGCRQLAGASTAHQHEIQHVHVEANGIAQHSGAAGRGGRHRRSLLLGGRLLAQTQLAQHLGHRPSCTVGKGSRRCVSPCLQQRSNVGRRSCRAAALSLPFPPAAFFWPRVAACGLCWFSKEMVAVRVHTGAAWCTATPLGCRGKAASRRSQPLGQQQHQRPRLLCSGKHAPCRWSRS